MCSQCCFSAGKYPSAAYCKAPAGYKDSTVRKCLCCVRTSSTTMTEVSTLTAAATACCSGLSSGAGVTSAAETAGAAAAEAAAGAGSMAGTGEASSSPSVFPLASVKASKAAVAVVSAAVAFASSSSAAYAPCIRSHCCNNTVKFACLKSRINVALKLY